MTPEAALKAAINILGGPSETAKALSSRKRTVSRQSVSQWKRCPPQYAVALDKAVKKALPRIPDKTDFRPDIFEPEITL